MICSHDALHGSAHGKRRGNDVVGWIGTLLFGLPFPMVRRAHLSHHAGEGEPDDSEQFAYAPGPTLPLRLLFGNWMYYLHVPRCNGFERGLSAATVALVIALVVCWPAPTLVGWVLPMQTGVCTIMVTTIWIPHGPFSRWWMDRFPFITGYHEDHHAEPAYPFHQIAQRRVRTYARRGVRRLLAASRAGRERHAPELCDSAGEAGAR